MRGGVEEEELRQQMYILISKRKNTDQSIKSETLKGKHRKVEKYDDCGV